MARSTGKLIGKQSMRFPLAFLVLVTVLPSVLAAQDDAWDDDWGEETQSAAIGGFVEAAAGARIHDDPLLESGTTLEELRWRIESDWQPGKVSIAVKGDLLYDAVETGWSIDVRDLTLTANPGSNTDLKIGRQVQTWGTGDLLFLNDLFPKDYVSFFAGRDDEYLKAPGNAVRISHYASAFNVDFSWTPVFEPDIYLDGERFSFFSPLAGGNVAPDPPLSAVEPDKSFSNGEFAVRLFRNFSGREIAIYGYRGFFKQPNALTESLQATYAAMNAWGASLRQTAGPGLFNSEVSYYDSRDDRSGSDPLLPNSQFRFLAGYEWEARANFSIGLQYYVEWTLDYDALVENSPFPQFEQDEFRQLLTNRLTYRAGRDRYTWSLFTFFSPNDKDFYLRPVFSYRHSDQWTVTAGANLFGATDAHTFFSSQQDASNAYLRVRFNY
jgi:hypothetical protein